MKIKLVEYLWGFREYVHQQGYIHIDLSCYTYDIVEGYQEGKDFKQLFEELF